MSYFIGPTLALAFLAIVVQLLTRKKLRERHAAWWIMGVLVALVLSLFPQVLTGVSQALGIEVPLNLVFLLSLAIVFFVNLQHGNELTQLEERVRTLAEHVASLEMAAKGTRSAPSPDSGSLEAGEQL